MRSLLLRFCLCVCGGGVACAVFLAVYPKGVIVEPGIPEGYVQIARASWNPSAGIDEHHSVSDEVTIKSSKLIEVLVSPPRTVASYSMAIFSGTDASNKQKLVARGFYLTPLEERGRYEIRIDSTVSRPIYVEETERDRFVVRYKNVFALLAVGFGSLCTMAALWPLRAIPTKS